MSVDMFPIIIIDFIYLDLKFLVLISQGSIYLIQRKRYSASIVREIVEEGKRIRYRMFKNISSKRNATQC